MNSQKNDSVFIVISRKRLWIHYFFREINLDSQSASQFDFEFTIFFPKSLSIHYFLQNQFGFTICFAISLWIHSIFSNSLSVLRIHLESTILFKPLWFWYEITMKSLWIHYLLHAFNKNSSSFSRMHYLFRKFSMNSLFFPEFTLNSLSASLFQYEYYLFREFTLNPRSFA